MRPRPVVGKAAVPDAVRRLLDKFDYPDRESPTQMVPILPTLGGAGGSIPTVWVVGPDASTNSRQSADYEGDGTNDEFELNRAITDLPATGGRVVYEGTLKIGAAIEINKPNVQLQGIEGVLEIAANSINVIEITSYDAVLDGVIIVNPAATYNTVRGVHINFTTNSTETPGGPVINRLQTSSLDNASIGDAASGSFAYRMHIFDCSFFEGTGAAIIDLNSTGDIRLANCWFVDNTATDMVNIAGTWKGTVHDNFLWNNTGAGNNFVLPANVVEFHNHLDTSKGDTDTGDHTSAAHTVVSHSDTTATGAELETLTDGSNADALHAHASPAHTIASHSDTTATGAELETLTDGSDADALHDHPNLGTGKTVIAGFTEDNLADSLTNSQLYRDVQSVDIQIPVVMSHSGHIVGISVASNEARSAGTATFEVFKNGAGTGLTTVLDGSDTQYASSAQATSLDTFVADDRLDIRVTTDGSWAPTTADVEAAITVQFDDASSNAWQDYTPTWTVDGGGGTSVGNGTLEGRYVRIGDTVHFWLHFVWGSTTSTGGAGAWNLTVPVAAGAAGDGAFPVRLLEAAVDNDTAIGYMSTTTTFVMVLSSLGNVVDGGTPFTWATADELTVSGTYEAA